ncbi:MAG: hypothetical protein ACREQJ_07085 [Candidatus Binatia bacterium]
MKSKVEETDDRLIPVKRCQVGSLSSAVARDRVEIHFSSEGFRMFRTAALLSAISVLGASAAFATGPRIERVVLEGYLDRAPESATVVEQLEIGRGEQARILYVTAANVAATQGVCPSCDAAFDTEGRFAIVGDDGDVRTLLESTPGTKVTGVFLRARVDRQLVVQDLDTKEGRDSVAAGDRIFGSEG